MIIFVRYLVDEVVINDFKAIPFKSRAEIIANSWRIVESIHFLILAQKQLYNGKNKKINSILS
jgi:hypothetical protein